jgi:hypothetical protein
MVGTTKKVNEMTGDEYFIYKVQLLAVKYGIEVEIDPVHRTVNFLTKDENLIHAVLAELSNLFE